MTLERAAIHESGHAVVAEALGLTVDAIEITPGRGETYLRNYPESRETALMLLAGYAAEARYDGEEFSLVGHLGSDDYVRAHDLLIFKLGLTGRILIDVRDATVILVEGLWPQITKLAEALKARQTVTGDVVRAMLR